MGLVLLTECIDIWSPTLRKAIRPKLILICFSEYPIMRHPDYHPAEAPPKKIATSESSNFVNPISLVCIWIFDTPTTPPPPHFPQVTSSYTLATFRSMALSPRSRPS
jgi:hypothetical protein